LPPVLGMKLTIGPPCSDSPNRPRRHHDFLRGFELAVARHAAAVDRGAGAEAVNLALSFVAAAAAAAEHDHAGLSCTLALPPPDTVIDGISSITPRTRAPSARLQKIEIECLLLLCRLDVDDRALAGDGNRFLEAADFNSASRRRRSRPPHESFALHGTEPVSVNVIEYVPGRRSTMRY